MQPGQYWCVADGSSFTAKCIEAVTGSPFYHCGIYVGGGLTVEALDSGVHCSPMSNYVGCHLQWSTMDLTDDQQTKICDAADSMIGRPYSFLDILALGLSAWDLVPAWVWNRLSRPDRVICSQLVAWSYSAAGVTLVPGKALCRITPGDLANVAQHRPVAALY